MQRGQRARPTIIAPPPVPAPPRSPGAYRLAQAMPSIQVPATVLAVLAARIDRLPLEEKRRLQTAAVIGTDVPFALRRAIADVPEGTLHRGLRRFSGHGLTRVRTELALEVLVHHLLVLHRCASQKDHGPQTTSTTAKSAASNRTLC